MATGEGSSRRTWATTLPRPRARRRRALRIATCCWRCWPTLRRRVRSVLRCRILLTATCPLPPPAATCCRMHCRHRRLACHFRHLFGPLLEKFFAERLAPSTCRRMRRWSSTSSSSKWTSRNRRARALAPPPPLWPSNRLSRGESCSQYSMQIWGGCPVRWGIRRIEKGRVLRDASCGLKKNVCGFMRFRAAAVWKRGELPILIGDAAASCMGHARARDA